MSNFSKKDIIRLGLGNILNINEAALFVDNNKITHRHLKDTKIDIVNKGTLRKPKPVLVVKEQINSQDKYTTYLITDILDEQKKEYYSEYISTQQAFGQISYFNCDKIFYSYKHNDFFIPFNQSRKENVRIGTNSEFPYVRLSYPSGQNSSIITGKSQTTGGLVNVTFNNNNNFTGLRALKVNSHYKTWKSSDTSGYTNLNYSGYYIPYPNTVQSYNYNSYNLSTKIAPYLNNIYNTGQDLNGILMITTGNNITSGSKICYISEHGLKTGYANTFVYISGSSKNPNTNVIESRKICTGIIVPCLFLGSEYYTGNVIPTTGITYNGNIASGEYLKPSVTGITGFVNNMKVDSDQYLKQNTPIQDTLYYKFYSGIYTGSKTFNTGTWDGIIPSGTTFTIELITPEFNKYVGTKAQLYLLYSGFGTNDVTDALITKYMTQNNITSGYFQNSNIYVGDYIGYKSMGRSYGRTSHESLINALINSRYITLSKISNLLKKFVPQFVKENRKLRKLRKFLNK